MAAALPTADEKPSGPKQYGRGMQGQYVYWVGCSHPKDEAVARLGLKRPCEFTREEFSELIVKAHADCDIEVLETASFLEITPSTGTTHHNCLLRAKTQFRWKKAAEHLFDKYNVRVGYASNIRTWTEGIV